MRHFNSTPHAQRTDRSPHNNNNNNNNQQYSATSCINNMTGTRVVGDTEANHAADTEEDEVLQSNVTEEVVQSNVAQEEEVSLTFGSTGSCNGSIRVGTTVTTDRCDADATATNATGITTTTTTTTNDTTVNDPKNNTNDDGSTASITTGSTTTAIQEEFDRLMAVIRDSKHHATDVGQFVQKPNLSTAQQLELYGLYKQSTSGTTTTTTTNNNTTSTESSLSSSNSSSSSSWWNINGVLQQRKEDAKRHAWDMVQHLSPNEAMQLYCQRFMEFTNNSYSNDPAAEVPSSLLLRHDIDHGTTPPMVGNTVVLPNDNAAVVQQFQNSDNVDSKQIVVVPNNAITNKTDTTTLRRAVVSTRSTLSDHKNNNNDHSGQQLLDQGPNMFSSTSDWFQTFILEDMMGIVPLQPRGTIDISYRDLYFAIRQCVRPPLSSSSVHRQQSLVRQCERDIQTRWIQAWDAQQQQRGRNNTMDVPPPPPPLERSIPSPLRTMDHHVMTGYSVRSLLDLFLLVQHYPPHSEIIVSPPITVPGMITVLQHHQINIIGIDLVSTPTTTTTTTATTKEVDNDIDNTDVIMSINLDGIRKAITTKTVAIMVVHVFGMIVASDQEMQQLRSIIRRHHSCAMTPTVLGAARTIAILEDCAQCFTGLHANAYLGSPFADLSFFSFGMIKTRTSIHGGIAIIWNEAQSTTDNTKIHNHVDKSLVLMESMTRKQASYYTEQSNLRYLQQVCKCLILKWISQSPHVYGLIYAIVAGVGGNFDGFVTRLLRGFPVDKQQMMNRLRQRPSLAMLALLRRRIYQATSTTTSNRVKLCQRITDGIIQNRRSEMTCNSEYQIRTIAPKIDCDNFHWLYPILVHDRHVVSKYLQQCGFDATGGTSQLCCVSSSSTCPVANRLISSVLYLPITSDSVPVSSSRSNCDRNNVNLLRLNRALKSVPQCGSSAAGVIDDTSLDVPDTRRIRRRASVPLILIGLLTVMQLQFVSICTIVIYLLKVAIGLSTIYATLLWLLRIKMGRFYLESSKGFAMYNYLLNGAERDHHLESQKAGSILEGIVSLQIPVTITGSEKRSVLLTGATGFVGSMLLRDLLFHRKTLNIECVVILCRAKKSKTASERIESLLDDAMFSFLSNSEKRTLVEVVEGDITLPRAGLSDATISCLVEHAHVTHIINCAASVSFTQSLSEAATANISSSLNIQALGSVLSKKSIQFVHVSTAFIHGGCFGDNGEPLLEELYSLGNFDPVKIYKSMTETQYYASKAMNELSFPNTYTFSKCVTEHLLLTNDPTTIIIRPSIIGPAVEFPYEGWAGRIPSTIVAAACLYLSYQLNIWSFGRHKVPIIPVDVVSRFIICKAFSVNHSEGNETISLDDISCDDSYEKISQSSSTKETSSTSSSDSERRFQIFNATWDIRSPGSSCFTWFEYAGAVTQVGCIKGYFSRPTAYLGLLIATKWIPNMKLSAHRFATIHNWCVKHPFDWISQLRTKLGANTSHMTRLCAYLNLPLLFYPFMNNSYHFHSELIAPPELSGERYLMTCVSAAHIFIQQSRGNEKKHQQNDTHLSLLSSVGIQSRVRGPSISWAISQPIGNILIRISGWLLVHILKRCFTEITIDVQSFTTSLSQKKTDSSCTIMAPTHRSIFDCLILTLVCFAVPELQIDMPSIAAADLFERLPLFGWLLHFLGVFFVQRGRMSVDPTLVETINSLKLNSICSGTVVEVFVEGTRSRDRRFVQPKTGVLRCLFHPGSRQTIVPITVNYERIAEQESLVEEACGRLPRGLHVPPMITWLFNVLRGRIKLGRVHIVACEPVLFDDQIELEMNDVVSAIQTRQASQIFASDYHIMSSSKVLNLDTAIVRRSFNAVGVKLFPTCSTKCGTPIVPSNASENLSILFQISPLLAPLCVLSHPNWSKWLWNKRGSVDRANKSAGSTDPDVRMLIGALVTLFDKADQCVDAAVNKLSKNGFAKPRPRHILQTALVASDDVPALLVQASIDIRFNYSKKANEKRDDCVVSSVVQRSKVGLDEGLGYWGFYGSQFVLCMDSDGSTFLRMDGDHYSLRGKKISGLISFFENETAISINPLDEAFAESSEYMTLSQIMIRDSDLDELKASVSNISQTNEERIRHGTGHSQEDIYLIRSKGILRVPDVVVRPASESEVEAVIKLAQIRKWCIIPFGGGTNVSNALRCPSYTDEPRPIISLDMRDMSQILWINEENGIAHVQAGITGRQLEQGLANRGYTMGHEPDSIEFSTLGGWIATKASGMKRSKYGNIEDIVKSVSVMGPAGVLKHGLDDKRHVWGRESCGIDLQNLVLGSEGCMGVITSACIRVCPLAESKDYDSVLFCDFHVGLRFVRELFRLGSDCPASVRLLDNEHFRLGHALRPDSNSVMTSFITYCFGTFLKWKANFDTKVMVCVTLMYEGSAAEVTRQKRAVNRIIVRNGGERLGSAAGRASYELTFMIAYLRDFALSYHFLGESFETFVPWSQIETVVAETKLAICQEHTERCLPGKPFIGCRVTQLYHEGACVYFYFCMNFEGVQNASLVYSEIEHVARSVILANGGSLSHHHGIGKLRSSFLPSINSAEFRGVIHKIKHVFDPDNIFGARNGGFSDC